MRNGKNTKEVIQTVYPTFQSLNFKNQMEIVKKVFKTNNKFRRGSEMLQNLPCLPRL